MIALAPWATWSAPWPGPRVRRCVVCGAPATLQALREGGPVYCGKHAAGMGRRIGGLQDVVRAVDREMRVALRTGKANDYSRVADAIERLFEIRDLLGIRGWESRARSVQPFPAWVAIGRPSA